MKIYSEIKNRYPSLFTTASTAENIDELITQKRLCEALFMLAELLELKHLPQEAQRVLEYANDNYGNPWTLANLTKHYLTHDQVQNSIQLIQNSSLPEDQKHFANALVLQRQKKYRNSLDYILKHCQKYPEDQSSRLELARTFVQYGLPVYGLEQINSISDYSIVDVDVLFVRAAALLRLYRIEEARSQYETILESNYPEAIKCRAFLGLARCNSMQGQMIDAVRLLEKVIDTKGSTTSQKIEATFELSKLEYPILDKKIEQIDCNPDNSTDQFLLAWAKSVVARNHQNTESYIESLIQANKIRFKEFCPENREVYLLELEHYLEKIFSTYDKVFKDLEPNPLSQKFIFIIGMPRSGTTVLEQILGSNSGITQLGETTYISLALDFLVNERNPNIPELQKKLTAFFSSHKIDAAQIITEKTPFNFLWIGFINKLFPKSLIVLIERDEIATKVSNFIQPFTATPLKYSFDWECLCGYYRIYTRILEMWNARGAKFTRIKYDDLVTNPQQIMNRLADDLNVSRTRLSSLDPRTNNRAISTASMYQASKKLKAASKDTYRKIYETLITKH